MQPNQDSELVRGDGVLQEAGVFASAWVIAASTHHRFLAQRTWTLGGPCTVPCHCI